MLRTPAAAKPRLTSVALAPLVLPLVSEPVGEAAPDEPELLPVGELPDLVLVALLLPEVDEPGGATFEIAETCVHFASALADASPS